MSQEAKKKREEPTDRKLGDEWLDWDGVVETTHPARKRLFIGVAAFAVAVLVGTVFGALWMIQPRLLEIDPLLYDIVRWAAYIFSGVIILWFAFLFISALTRIPILGRLLIIPLPVNWLLNMVLRLRKIIGVSADRLVNSFLRTHNLLFPDRRLVSPDELLVLLPRCLKREDNAFMREMRDTYGFKMATAGGGQEARKQIKSSMPRVIIAVACERDLLSGFLEVNPHIPVLGMPIKRPEGPCKNTEIDKKECEALIRRFLCKD